MAADAAELNQATSGNLTDHLAAILSARYAALLANWNGEATDDFRTKLRALRELCQDIVSLRRGDHSGARLFLEQKRLEEEREKTREELAKQFEEWALNPTMRECLCAGWVSREERQRRLREILGEKPKAVESKNGAPEPTQKPTEEPKSG